MLGDIAAAFVVGLSEVDQVKSLAKFEAAGLEFAVLSFVHFDWDRHGAKRVMVAERKRTLDPNVFVSMRHCGNVQCCCSTSCRPQAISFGLVDAHWQDGSKF